MPGPSAGLRPVQAQRHRRQLVDVAVPAYFHPSEHPELWRRLGRAGDRVRFVVVNPSSGVGERLDSAYHVPVLRLLDAGVQLTGYIDSAYGNRPVAEVVEEARAYRERYGVSAVFLDQVAGTVAALDYYEPCVLALRGAGVRFLVLNPGAYPHPAYVDLANVTVSFEGCWADYQESVPPPWATRVPARRFCHLVYDVPREVAERPDQTVRARHAMTACLTGRSGANPWDRLPEVLRAEAADSLQHIT